MALALAGAVAWSMATGGGRAGAQRSTGRAAQPAPAELGPVPSAERIAAGQVVEVLVQVRGVSDLNAVDVRLGFDPTVLEVVDADEAAEGVQIELLDGFLRPDFVLANHADNAGGSVWFAATQLRPSLPVTGTGDLARVGFRALRAGSSGVTVTDQRLVRPSGDPLEVATFEAVVAVGEGGPTRTPPPSATATPSATPSPPGTAASPTADATARTTPSLEPTPTDPPEAGVLYCPFASLPR